MSVIFIGRESSLLHEQIVEFLAQQKRYWFCSLNLFASNNRYCFLGVRWSKILACQEHCQQTDRYLMGWLERHFVEFPWHLLLQCVLQIYRWSVLERHFAASRGRDEQGQCPTETLLPPSPGIILRTGHLFQLRSHCFSLAIFLNLVNGVANTCDFSAKLIKTTA